MPYDDTLPTDLDKARARLGDTAATELLTDDHIEAVLSLYGFNGGVAFLARELDMRFALQPSSVTLPSGLSVSYARRTWAGLIALMESASATAFSVTPSRNDGYSEVANT